MKSLFTTALLASSTKDAASKVTGDLKVGSKVTIEYTMAAKTIEVKEDKKLKK